MNIDQLAGEAVSGLADRLVAGVSDRLVTMVGDRLGGSKTGSRALAGLRENPADPAQRELTESVLADELGRDPGFASQLAEALGKPTTQVSTVTIARGKVRGDVAGGNIDKSKRYHIGSIRFGGGGLAALVLVGVLGAGGATVGVYNAVTTKPSYTSQPLEGADFGTTGTSADLDEIQRRLAGDGVPDINYGITAITATGGARIGPLPAGVVPNPERCAEAIDGHGARSVEDLQQADVICVETSRGAMTAITLSTVNPATANTTIYSLDYAYWARG